MSSTFDRQFQSAVRFAALGSLMVIALSRQAAADDLQPRQPLPKRDFVARPGGDSRLVLKFCDAAKARITDRGLVSLAGVGMADVRELIDEHNATLQPLFSVPEGRIRTFEQRAAARSGKAQPDYAGIMVVEAADETLEQLANQLNALEITEFVYFARLLVPPPCTDIAPTTPSFVSLQTHFGPDPGLNMTAARQLGNARGAGITLADAEYGYTEGHEDLCNIVNEPNQTVHSGLDDAYIQHGTATLGEVVGLDNAYGCEGLVPDVNALFFPEYTQEEGPRREEAILNAVTAAEPGDVVMLEMQSGDPNDPNDTDWGPAELEATVWLIVNSATDTEIIVVAAAGNGDQDLDSAEYDYYMGRGDSGAIIVGAGTADTSHDRLPFSTYGSRLNLQGWGESVVTLGYGDLAIIGDDENQMYTDIFSGTSSATPMVTSAVVAVQGLAVEAIGRRLDPWEMREVLVLTGIPQGSGGHIGPIPDVLAAGQAVDTIPGTWVDFEYSGPEVGTFLYPYNSLLEGVTAVTPGGTLAFKPGSTLEPTTISRAMTLRAVGGAVTIGS